MIISTLQTISFIVGIVYFIKNSNSQLKTSECILKSQEQATEVQKDLLETRKAQMLMQIYNESYNNDLFIDAYVTLADFNIHSYAEYEKLMEDEEVKKASTKVAMFFEGIGLLVREDQINIKLFAQLMTGMTRSWWERLYKPILAEGRKSRDSPNWMSESEYLYNEIIKIPQGKPRTTN
jgi:hypothetical protein